MRKFLILLGREVKSSFYSPIAYVVLFFFLLLTGFNFFSIISAINHRQIDATIVQLYFRVGFFWFAFLLPFPLVTMRLFSEEFKLGTVETLMTAPIRDWQVVASKFVGAVIFFMLLWLPSLLYFLVFRWITRMDPSSAAGAYWGTYVLILLLGMLYTSIGCLASALTRNQIIAAIISLVVILISFFWGVLAEFIMNVSPAIRDVVGYFSTIEHMQDFSSGIIDTRPIVFYLSMTGMMLFLTYQVFQYRKWKA